MLNSEASASHSMSDAFMPTRRRIAVDPKTGEKRDEKWCPEAREWIPVKGGWGKNKSRRDGLQSLSRLGMKMLPSHQNVLQHRPSTIEWFRLYGVPENKIPKNKSAARTLRKKLEKKK
jgi:hypothetical protein